MDTLWILFTILLIAAIFVVRGNNAEGWQPFAWYGAPPGTYKAAGDWKGVVPATTEVEEIVPPKPADKKKNKKKQK